MSVWRQLTRGLRVLVHRPAADRKLTEEIEHYVEQATEAHLARGLSPAEARRAARVELGSATAVREEVRAHGWENLLGTFVSDLGYGVRRLRRSPGFTAVSVITLALGIGATTAIFSAVNPILFEPLPYPHPERVVMLWYNGADGSRGSQSFGSFRELATRSRSFDALAVMKPWQPTMTGPAQPERFDGQSVSAEYFRTLGVTPNLGHDFDPADDRPKGPNVVILSDSVWRRRFNADATIVGRQVTLDDTSYTVIGVLPRTFENVLAPAAEVWSLLQYDSTLPPESKEWGHHLRLVARLRAGASPAQVRQELGTIARHPVPEFARPAYASMSRGIAMTVLRDEVTSGVKPALLAVIGAVVLLLFIACVNVTNLLLARGAQRRGELAVRAVLGAGRRRLIRQLLTESVLLAVIGGALGMAVAELGVRALVAFSPAGLPRIGAIAVNGTVFLFALCATTLTGLMVGLIPALNASRSNLSSGLQQGSRRTAGGDQFTRRTLVVVEVALALVLLVGAGLLYRSLDRLFRNAPGFDASHMLAMQVQVSGRRFDDATTRRFFDGALDAVRRVPGVDRAAFTSELPLCGEGQNEVYGVTFEHDADPHDGHDVFRYAVTPGYFEAMGIPLRRGRLFDHRDLAAASVRPILINESLAKRKFAGIDPIGQRIRVAGPPTRHWDEIVGVVGDVKQISLAASRSDAVYGTTAQWLWADSAQWLVVRVREGVDVTAITPAVRAAIWSVDKDQPITRVARMESLVAATEAERRFALNIFAAFALVALLLAATGIYGVLSGSVAERTREIGIRAALGASRTDILALIGRQAMTLTSLGIALGVAGAIVVSRLFVALLYGITNVDALTYTGVIALLLGVSAIACSVPAWRAARVDPAVTLRAD